VGNAPMNPQNYEFVRYQPDLKGQVVELQTHLWSPSLALNTAYFEWKYERNPYLDEPLIYLAMYHGKSIGMRGFFGAQWEGGVPAQRFTSLYADDMVIAPEHRRRGLVSELMTSAFEDLDEQGYEYVFNLSAGEVTLHSSLSMGWRSAGWAHPMRRQSWRTALQSRFLGAMNRLPVVSRKLAGFGSQRSTRSHCSLDDVDLKCVSRVLRCIPPISVQDAPRCAAMAELVERIGSTGRIRHVRDSQYFQWRFQNPLSRYRFLFWEEDRLEGYLVLQEYTSEYSPDVLNIVDWEASNAAILSGLLQAAVSVFAKARRLIIWSATLPPPTIALLQMNGFHSVRHPKAAPSPPAILVRPIHRGQLDGEWMLAGRRLLDLASWDLRMLYSMQG
jgi:GNAT superfamily N-acetyltransferase